MLCMEQKFNLKPPFFTTLANEITLTIIDFGPFSSPSPQKTFFLLKWKVLYMCFFYFIEKRHTEYPFLCAHMLPFLCILFILISYEYGRVEKFFFPKTSHAFNYKPPFLSEKNHFSGLHPSHSISLCFTLTDNILLAFGYPIN